MTGFVVADLCNSLIRCVWETEVYERGFVESLHALLVEAEDGPFGTEEVLKGNVVFSRRASGGCWNRSRAVCWEWCAFAGVVAIYRRLSGYWATVWVASTTCRCVRLDWRCENNSRETHNKQGGNRKKHDEKVSFFSSGFNKKRYAVRPVSVDEDVACILMRYTATFYIKNREMRRRNLTA